MSVPDAQGQDGFTRDFYMLDDQDSEFVPHLCIYELKTTRERFRAQPRPTHKHLQDLRPVQVRGCHRAPGAQSLPGHSALRQVCILDIEWHTPALFSSSPLLFSPSARVVLNKELSGNPDDYINASYVRNLLPGSPEYIAAQGPTEATTAHFWKMVAQERGRVVVMVTRLVENNRSKCHQYWPDAGQSAVFPASHAGPEVRVTAIAERTQPCWTEREFEVRDQGPGLFCGVEGRGVEKAFVSNSVFCFRWRGTHAQGGADALYGLARPRRARLGG